MDFLFIEGVLVLIFVLCSWRIVLECGLVGWVFAADLEKLGIWSVWGSSNGWMDRVGQDALVVYNKVCPERIICSFEALVFLEKWGHFTFSFRMLLYCLPYKGSYIVFITSYEFYLKFPFRFL